MAVAIGLELCKVFRIWFNTYPCPTELLFQKKSVAKQYTVSGTKLNKIAISFVASALEYPQVLP